MGAVVHSPTPSRPPCMFPPGPLSPPRPPGQHDILGSHPLTLWPPRGLLPGRRIPASCRPTTPLHTTHGTTCTCSHVTTPTALLTRVHPSPCHRVGEGPRRPRERPGGDPVVIMCPDGQPRLICNSMSGRPVWPTPHFWFPHPILMPPRPLMQPPSTMAGPQPPPRELRSASPGGGPRQLPKESGKNPASLPTGRDHGDRKTEKLGRLGVCWCLFTASVRGQTSPP